ncbi:MAG: serine--tRNA ligase, partial [Bradyrhizobium icense]
MHDIKVIRDDPGLFVEALGRRGADASGLALTLVGLDGKRREAILASEQLLARRKALSKEVNEAKKSGDDQRAQALMAEVGVLKEELPALEASAKLYDEQLKTILRQVPNLPLEDVPNGTNEHGNVQRHIFGAARSYGFVPKPHDDLGSALGCMDFEAAAKLSGARFVVLKKGLARLERAIGQFMLDLHTGEHGYTEVNPPLLVRENVMFGTGQLPKFEDDQFEALAELRKLQYEYDAKQARLEEA